MRGTIMNRLQRTTVAFCATVLVFTGLAGATIETFKFSGTVGNVHDKTGMFEGIEKGTEFTGSYWIDTEKIKEIQNSLARKNSYAYSLFEGDEEAFGMKVAVGDTIFVSGSKQNARITSYSNKNQESFSLCAYADTENSRSTKYVALSFSGKKNALGLDSDPLLLDGADLKDKNISATMTYLDYHSDTRKKGNSFSYAYATGALGSFRNVTGGGPTPEPGTLAILFLGGGVLVLRHKRKQKTVI